MKGKFLDLSRTPGGRISKFDLILLPVGAIERHGNHLPLGTDTIIANEIAKRVGEALAEEGFVVGLLPPIWYGYTWSLRFHDGTASVDPHILSKYVEEVLVSLSNPRFSKFLIINGHGGNKEPLEVAVKEALLRLGAGISIGTISWWQFLEEKDLEAILPGSVPLHACEIETSIMLHLCPDCVDLTDVRPVKPAPRKLLRSIEGARRTFSYGYLGDPRKASAEAGKKILDLVVSRIVSTLKEELKEEFSPTEVE